MIHLLKINFCSWGGGRKTNLKFLFYRVIYTRVVVTTKRFVQSKNKNKTSAVWSDLIIFFLTLSLSLSFTVFFLSSTHVHFCSSTSTSVQTHKSKIYTNYNQRQFYFIHLKSVTTLTNLTNGSRLHHCARIHVQRHFYQPRPSDTPAAKGCMS